MKNGDKVRDKDLDDEHDEDGDGGDSMWKG